MCKGEYDFLHFRFDHSPKTDFYYAQCDCIVPLSVVGYRFFCAVYCMFFWTFSLGTHIVDNDDYRWFIFYTSWVYIVCTFFFAYSFFISFIEICQVFRCNDNNGGQDQGGTDIPAEGRFRSNQTIYDDIELDVASSTPSVNLENGVVVDDDDRPGYVDSSGVDDYPLPWRFRILWFLENIALNTSILVTIAYWVFLRDTSVKLHMDMRTYFKLDRHGIVALMMLIEFFLNRIPWRVLHFIYPLSFTLAYQIFQLTYWRVAGDRIYDMLDWKNDVGHTLLYYTGTLVSCIVIQIFLFYCHKCKDRKR